MNGSGDRDLEEIIKDDVGAKIVMTAVPVVVVIALIIISIITAVATVSCCCGYHLNKRKRDLTAEGGVIVLSEDLRRASSEGRLVVNVSLLDRTKVILG